jgi:hypothetical protein
MNSPLIRKFCESRYHWPIVATATALIALATVVPQADDYFDNRTNRNELSEELAHARQTAQALPTYERRAAAIRENLEALDARSVDETGLAPFRSRLVGVVRDSGCQIRRIELGTPLRRPWKQDDDPLTPLTENPNQAQATPFTLERRIVLLAVDGPMPAILDLLARLEQERTLSHPHRVHLQPASSGGENVMLELDMWLFALARPPS